MQKNVSVSFKKGKTPRYELELPTLHFVVMDQWVDLIGEKALFSWLKMYTWCKRDEENSEFDLWEQAKIPTSYNKVIKKLGVGKDTFYNKILKPLWNVGLIDIEEYEDSESKGNKPMNIIVYKYPQNQKSLSHQELVMIRDYDKEYHSKAKTFATQGGRPKKEQDGSDSEPPKKDGSQTEPPMVLKQNHLWFSNRTTDGSQIGHNNIFNSFSNSFNSLNNILNSISNNLNSSSSNSDKSGHVDFLIENQEEEEKEEKNDIDKFTIDFLENELKYSPYIVNDIIKHMKQNKVTVFTPAQMKDQARRIELWVSKNKKEIGEFGYFFVNGILKYDPSNQILNRDNELKRISLQRKEQKEIEYFTSLFYQQEGRYPTSEEIENRESYQSSLIPFYNWLEN